MKTEEKTEERRERFRSLLRDAERLEDYEVMEMCVEASRGDRQRQAECTALHELMLRWGIGRE